MYRELQEWIIGRRRLQQRSDALESSSRELVRTSDGIVVKHLVECALPPQKRSSAAEVTSKVSSAAARSRITTQGDVTEHTTDNRGDDEEADDQRQAISTATEHATKSKKQLK